MTFGWKLFGLSEEKILRYQYFERIWDKNMLSLEKIHDVIGYLVLTEDGAVLSSGGELENDEKSANIITGLIQMTDKYVVRVIFMASMFKRFY